MCSEMNSENLDFLFEKDCKSSSESSINPWLCSDDFQKSFKEELFVDDLQKHLKSEYNDFDMEQLLGSCFDESEFSSTVASFNVPGCMEDGAHKMELKEEEIFESFDDFVSLPFNSVMDSLDDVNADVASDSGHSSNDTSPDDALSPSSGTVSPDLLDQAYTDADADIKSDVSSTSDLGSLASGNSSPNYRKTEVVTPVHVRMANSFSYEDDPPVPDSPISTREEKQSAENNSIKMSSKPRITRVFRPVQSNASSASVGSSIPSIATRTIKLDLSQHKTSPTNINGPLQKKIRLDTSANSGPIRNIQTKTSMGDRSPQTIVVTQAGNGKTNSAFKNGTLLRTGNGKSILLPVNVKDLNQVRTIKIINPGLNNANRMKGSQNVIRSVTVSNVKSMGSVATTASSVPLSQMRSTSTAGNRSTFFTASKGADGRAVFKVTPTAFVSPNQHSVVSSVSPGSMLSSAVVKQEISDDEYDDDPEEERPKPNQRLILTDEERKLMRKEGLVLPPRYPLTKQQERDLKRIRRKIRNKISAQDSRKRKKEYVDGLEDRVKSCIEENKELQNRIRHLERQNESLLSQLKKSQNSFGNPLSASRNNPSSTALMMLMLSAALFVLPSLRPENNKENELRNNKIPSAGQSRSLLEANTASMHLQNSVEEYGMPDEESVIDSRPFSSVSSDHDYYPPSKYQRVHYGSKGLPSHSIEKQFLRDLPSDPPDGLTKGMNMLLDSLYKMIHPFGENHGNSSNGALKSQSSPKAPSSVLVNLERKIMTDIELE